MGKRALLITVVVLVLGLILGGVIGGLSFLPGFTEPLFYQPKTESGQLVYPEGTFNQFIFSARKQVNTVVQDVRLLTFSESQRQLALLDSTPMVYKGPDRYGVEKIIPENPSDDKQYYSIGGIISSVADNRVVIQTGNREFAMVKSPSATCFSETPYFGPEVKGETVDCSAANIPLNSYGLATVEVQPTTADLVYTYLLFVKPELLPTQ